MYRIVLLKTFIFEIIKLFTILIFNSDPVNMKILLNFELFQTEIMSFINFELENLLN